MSVSNFTILDSISSAGVRADAEFEPFEESFASLSRDAEHLAGGKFFLLDDVSGNIAASFEPLQNGVRLTLTQMPDMPQFGCEFLVEVVTVTLT